MIFFVQVRGLVELVEIAVEVAVKIIIEAIIVVRTQQKVILIILIFNILSAVFKEILQELVTILHKLRIFILIFMLWNEVRIIRSSFLCDVFNHSLFI